jgi:hypothetical protein
MSTLTNTLWGKLGELDEEEALHVLTKLFETYEKLHVQNPHDSAVVDFFNKLDTAIRLTRECNLNRR